MNCPGSSVCEAQEYHGCRNCGDASGQCVNKENAMNFDVIVVYPGDCLALLNLDIQGESSRDWECNSATLVKLAAADYPSKRQGNTWVLDWTKLPALNITLDASEIADQYEVQICDGITAANEDDKLDYGDWKYEQMKDRRMGL